MRSQIIPNRLSISNRNILLGFRLLSHGTPQLAEVTLATDPALFRNPAQRSPDNFFSTASMGPLQILEDEAVYVVPAEILARFVGKERLYFALATKPLDQSTGYQVQVMPDADSVFISMAGLTNRGLRRVRTFPNRGAQIPGYGGNGQAILTWAGDTAQPGADAVDVPQHANHGQDGAGMPATAAPQPARMTPAPYNDGFGDLPPLPEEAMPPAAAHVPDEGADDPETAEEIEDEAEARAEEAIPSEDAAIAAMLGVRQPAVRDVAIGEQIPAQAPDVSDISLALRLALEAAMVANPALATTVAAIRLANAQGLSVGLGVAVSGGFAAGGALGAGIIFAPDNKLGVYGVGELDLGAIFSLSATVQMTVLNGGISAFEGITFVAGFSAGEGIVGGGAAIFNDRSEYIGMSVEIGLGIGSPLDVYAGVQRGVAQGQGFAAAFGAEPITAEPMLRDSTADARRYVPRWRHLLRWRAPSAIRSAVSRRGFSIQSFASARGDLNIDLLEVRVSRLPSGQSAEDLIRHIRVNMARFVNPTLTRFDFYAASDATKWRGSRPEGAVFNLRIPGDNAAVVASMVRPRKWRFTTIETPVTGSHPVSGHREFGIRETDDDGFIIYTRGADRFTYPSALGALETPAFAVAERLWRSFQEKVADHVNSNGGSARVLTPFRRHFSWRDTSRALSSSGSRASSQSLSINESFTINWDAVQKIAQPTDMSCWAAAAAMIVGWRDKMSLSPTTIAEIAGRPIKRGLDPDNIQDLGTVLGLTAVAGQSFTATGFRDLLEDSGPVWVGIALPGSLHAIVVTGMYNDEDGDLMVRVTDPWDRIVGTPGSPGRHKRSHRTGSRYIMTWEAFQQEYELMGASTTGRSFQILHADGHHGHTLNRGTQSPPPGYAAALMEDHTEGPASAAPPVVVPAQPASIAVTISEEAAPVSPAMVIPMSGPNGVPTDIRWSNAITEVLGADHVAVLAALPALAAARGWTIAVGPDTPQSYGAAGVGIAPGGSIFRYGGDPVATPATANGGARLLVTIAEGAPELFTQWAKARSFATDTQVTGAVLMDGTDMPLALAMRLAAASGLPGQIEAISEAVTAAFKPVVASPSMPPAIPVPAPTPQQAPAPAVAGTEVIAPAVPPAAASALAAMMGVSSEPPAFEMPGGALPPSGGPMPPMPGNPAPMPIVPPHPDGEFPPPGVTMHRSDVMRDGVNYSVFLMNGKVLPEVTSQEVPALIPGPQVVLDKWPYMDTSSGRSHGSIVIDWSYAAGAVGNVRTAPIGGAALDGWAVAVTTDIGPGPSTVDETKLTVTARTTFTKAGEQTRVGVCQVILCGSGQHQVSHVDESLAPQPVLA